VTTRTRKARGKKPEERWDLILKIVQLVDLGLPPLPLPGDVLWGAQRVAERRGCLCVSFKIGDKSESTGYGTLRTIHVYVEHDPGCPARNEPEGRRVA